MKRTGSIGSRVPPAVTTMWRPTRSASRDRLLGERRARRGLGLADRSTGDRGDHGVDDPWQLRQPADAGLPGRERPAVRLDDRRSRRRPEGGPRSPASPGGSTCRRPWPARRRPGADVARQAAVTTSPARPLAIAPSQWAVAGATTIASAVSAMTMWPIRPSGRSSMSSVSTGWRESAAKDSGPTKRVAEGESRTTTSAPSAVSSRSSSTAL